jgi:hypothetical protein
MLKAALALISRIRWAVLSIIFPTVWPIDKQRRNHPHAIESYEHRVYSQHGEDGILAELFSRLGITNGTFIEMSVNDGTECNTALLARNYGWSGLMVEGSDLALAARAAFAPFSSVRVVQSFITAENVVDLFVETKIPTEFDLLSIDLDGNDYWIWKTLAAYRPKVVIIEYNASHAPPLHWVMPYNASHTWPGESWNFGASLVAYETLGKELGYALLGTESSGANAFFIREDLLPSIRFPRKSAAESYHPPHRLHYTGSWAKATVPSGVGN